LTTTIFRKDGNTACIACDSRVTWIENDSGFPLRWFDSTDFRKAIIIDDVMYGFAGSNAMFKIFLEHYSNRDDSEFVLDTVVKLAKGYRVQFFIIRYDGVELKLFGYSPKSEIYPEIFRSSADPSIPKSCYAIGSGKESKEYKKHKISKNAQLPIMKIISANSKGLKKAGMLDLNERVAKGNLDLELSKQAYFACQNKGGDLFTGGDVNMSQSATREQITEQVAIMNRMDQEAKANGAVCASPINATLEVQQLKSMGLKAVSDNRIDSSEKRMRLYRKMEESLIASI
jgi:hypothetical protein